MKGFLIRLVLASIVGLTLGVYIGNLTANDDLIPVFKVDDCIQYYTKGNEFELPSALGEKQKVLQIGKEGYLVTSYNGTEYLHFYKQNYFKKVECK